MRIFVESTKTGPTRANETEIFILFRQITLWYPKNELELYKSAKCSEIRIEQLFTGGFYWRRTLSEENLIELKKQSSANDRKRPFWESF